MGRGVKLTLNHFECDVNILTLFLQSVLNLLEQIRLLNLQLIDLIQISNKLIEHDVISSPAVKIADFLDG
jgi:hypothetical protein